IFPSGRYGLPPCDLRPNKKVPSTIHHSLRHRRHWQLEDLGDLKREATDPLSDRSRPSPSTGNLHGPVFPRSFGSPRVPQVPCRRKNLWPLRPVARLKFLTVSHRPPRNRPVSYKTITCVAMFLPPSMR